MKTKKPMKKMSPKQYCMADLVTLEGLFTGEKVRGALASTISGSIATGLNLLGVAAFGLSASTSAVLFTFLLGSFLSYVLDILIAKRSFVLSRGDIPRDVPYARLGQRALWLIRSFGHRFFYRFVVTVIVETLTGIAILRAVIKELDEHRVLPDWKLRDAFAAISVAVVVFLLFGNILRFDWAYKEVEHPVLNMIVLLWMGMTMIVFAASYGVQKKSEGDSDQLVHGFVDARIL